MQSRNTIALLAGAALVVGVFTGAPAMAQQNTGSIGTTTGPASGTPTTGTVPASPHQLQTLQNRKGADAQRDAVGGASTGAPGKQGVQGAESGAAPAAAGGPGNKP